MQLAANYRPCGEGVPELLAGKEIGSIIGLEESGRQTLFVVQFRGRTRCYRADELDLALPGSSVGVGK